MDSVSLHPKKMKKKKKKPDQDILWRYRNLNVHHQTNKSVMSEYGQDTIPTTDMDMYNLKY
jgi:hypothetical protein